MTDNKQKIRYLKEYIDIVKECAEVRQYYMSKAYSIQAQTISDMPMGGAYAHDTVGAKLAKLDTIDEMVNKRLLKLEAKRIEIEGIIDRLDESIHRRLMHMRYIQGLAWEQIAVNINYTWRHVHNLHSDALERVDL